MSRFALPLLAVVGVGMIVLALWTRHRTGERATARGLAGLLALLGAASGLAGVLGDEPAWIVLPLGPGGAPAVAVLDGLAGWFLVALFAGLAAAILGAPGTESQGNIEIIGPILLVIPATAILLAGDAISLLTALAAALLAPWALILRSPLREAARAATRGHLAHDGAALLFFAAALFAAGLGGTAGPVFASIRALSAEPGDLASLLSLAGALALARLPPARPEPSPPFPVLPATAQTLRLCALRLLAIYLALRLAVDLAAPAQASWIVAAWILAGLAAIARGAGRETRAEDMLTVLDGSAERLLGLMLGGVGLVLAARAADRTDLAALTLDGVLLLGLGHALTLALHVLAAAVAAHCGGTRSLARLGGLAQRLPRVAACVLIGALAGALLPPSLGFTGLWLLFQATIALAGAVPMPLAFILIAAAAGFGLATGLGTLAMVRLVGLAWLGRPRTPRAAAAEEPGPAPRWTLVSLALLVMLPGLAPGPLVWLADGVARDILLAPQGPAADRLHPDLGLPVPGGRYAPALPTLVALSAGAAIWLWRRRGTAAGTRRVPRHEDGYVAAPAYLPFGEPSGQPGPAQFTAAAPPPWRMALSRVAGPANRLARYAAGLRGRFASQPGRVLAAAARPFPSPTARRGALAGAALLTVLLGLALT
jgi:formate hydrogenlyase subunit 3/multisubunit Na+/H+ antiporter MnhD subunit